MKISYFFSSLFLLFASCGATTKTKPTNMDIASKQSCYDFKLRSLDGKEEISLERYKGKKILLVNVASKCGYTPQYEQLQTLHEKHGDKVAILGFPANNFGAQEPGNLEEIATFCQKNYGVTFQMFEKISVKGEDQHPLYQWLSKKDLNGWNDQAPSWNFCKYLVDEKGELVKFFSSGASPMGTDILKAIGI